MAMHLLKYLQVELPLRCLGLGKVVLLVVSFPSYSSAEAKVN